MSSPRPTRKLLVWWLSAAVATAALAGSSGCVREAEDTRDLIETLVDADRVTDCLDLRLLASDPHFERRGWSALEGDGVAHWAWAVDGRSRLHLPLYSNGDKELRLRARSHPSLGPALALEVLLNENPVGSVTLTPLEQELRIVLPKSLQTRGNNVLTLLSSRRHEPPPGEADQRRLVAAFSTLEVRPLGSAAPPTAPSSRNGRLLLPPRSAVRYPVRITESTWLRVRGTSTAAARLRISLEDDEGRADLLVAHTLPPGKSFEQERVLRDWTGSLAQLEVSNAGSSGDLLLETLHLRSTRRRLRAGNGPALGFMPHVVIYLVDTLRADRLGAYGHPRPTSPRFDAFTRESILFEDAWAQASWTRPATASILTGLFPSAHLASREDQALGEKATTLAELLAAAGYRTGGFVANHLVGGRFGFNQGFQTWNDGTDALYGAPAAHLGERALSWLDRGEGPFFLYVHTLEPHSPYAPELRHARPFAAPHYTGNRDTRALLRQGQLGHLAPDALRFLESQYQGEIRQNDEAFGALLDGLRSRGLLDRSVIVFLSDHGEELTDHGGTEHAKTLYQELVRIPLAVRLPGARRGGTRERAPVQQIDLLPTLLRIIGVEPPSGLPGRDLSTRWVGGPEAKSETSTPLLFAEERFTVVNKFAARAGPWKLILNVDGEALWRAGTPVELYDLTSDPGERFNLVNRAPIAARYLRQELDRFRQQAAASKEGRTLTLTPEEEQQLRALGYVQ